SSHCRIPEGLACPACRGCHSNRILPFLRQQTDWSNHNGVRKFQAEALPKLTASLLLTFQYLLLHRQKVLVLQEHGQRLIVILNDQRLVEFPELSYIQCSQ